MSIDFNIQSDKKFKLYILKIIYFETKFCALPQLEKKEMFYLIKHNFKFCLKQNKN